MQATTETKLAPTSSIEQAWGASSLPLCEQVIDQIKHGAPTQVIKAILTEMDHHKAALLKEAETIDLEIRDYYTPEPDPKNTRNGTDSRDGDYQGTTPLVVAIDLGRSDVVEAILSEEKRNPTHLIKADVNQVCTLRGEKVTALQLAIIKGDAIAISALRRCGADLNAKDAQGRIPLMQAMAQVPISIEVLDALIYLDRGSPPIDVNVTDEFTESPIYEALSKVNAPAFLLLLKAGADLTRFNFSIFVAFVDIHCPKLSKIEKDFMETAEALIDYTDFNPGNLLLFFVEKVFEFSPRKAYKFLMKALKKNVFLTEETWLGILKFAFAVFDHQRIQKILSYVADISIVDELNRHYIKEHNDGGHPCPEYRPTMPFNGPYGKLKKQKLDHRREVLKQIKNFEKQRIDYLIKQLSAETKAVKAIVGDDAKQDAGIPQTAPAISDKTSMLPQAQNGMAKPENALLNLYLYWQKVRTEGKDAIYIARCEVAFFTVMAFVEFEEDAGKRQQDKDKWQVTILDVLAIFCEKQDELTVKLKALFDPPVAAKEEKAAAKCMNQRAVSPLEAQLERHYDQWATQIPEVLEHIKADNKEQESRERFAAIKNLGDKFKFQPTQPAAIPRAKIVLAKMKFTPGQTLTGQQALNWLAEQRRRQEAESDLIVTGNGAAVTAPPQPPSP